MPAMRKARLNPATPPPKPKHGHSLPIQRFEETRETLRNNISFTLGEIILLRENYDLFVASVNSFLNLLDEFHAFYSASAKFAISLEDMYFVENYSKIRDTLISLRRQIYRAIRQIEAIYRAYITNHPGRRNLSVENSIDWDETPTIYENTTIAHGHILHFKQQWKAEPSSATCCTACRWPLPGKTDCHS